MNEPENPINKIVQEIIKKRNTIKDDFCKAYLAENMKDIPIKDLVLNEQRTDAGNYRWWFSVKDEEYMK